MAKNVATSTRARRTSKPSTKQKTTPPSRTTKTTKRPKAVNGFQPSPQQQAIFNWIEKGTGNAFIEATAGSGKTTTLVQAIRFMSGSVAFTAYNKKIAQEIEAKTKELMKQNLRVGTFHSFGFNAWRRVHRDLRVDPRSKKEFMLTSCSVPERLHSVTHKLVSLGKQTGVEATWPFNIEHIWWQLIEHYDIDTELENPRDVDALIRHAMNCIAWSKKNGMHVIDFDDMIWLPVVHDVRMDQYNWVLVDESQDSNEARRLLAAKMLEPNGRLIMVGDRFQAIYGFTGADNDAVDRIIKTFNCTQLPLTVTYRCPKAVVAEARKFVPHITAHDSAPQGLVRTVTADEFMSKEIVTLDPNDAILCRNTKPLIELAFTLIRRKVPCHVEGRDIGEGLMKLATRWKIKTIHALRERLEAYKEREIEKLLKKKRESAADALTDRVDTLFVLMENCHTVDDVVQKIKSLFQDTDGTRRSTVTLSTVHKAKGREWPRVYILGWSEYMPSKWASLPWQQEQERNLQYVAVTRSKGELIYMPAMEAWIKAHDGAKPNGA